MLVIELLLRDLAEAAVMATFTVLWELLVPVSWVGFGAVTRPRSAPLVAAEQKGRTLPPRWGKGRVGGVAARLGGRA